MKFQSSLFGASFLAAIALCLLVSTSPARAQARPSYALSFDGVDDHVTVPDHDALTGTNAFTWEAWVNITKTNWPYYEEWGTIFAKDNFGGEGWFAVMSNGVVDVRFNGQSFSAQSSNAIAFQTWQHVAVTWDGSDVRYYLNGQLNRTVAYSSPIIANTASSLLIGISPGIGSYRFQGQMDELRLWNVARSPAEIQAAMKQPLTGSETGLVAYWPFDEASGTTAGNRATATGSACDGTLVNAPTWVASTLPFAPDVASAAATGIGATNATLNGTINLGNLPTTAWFEWGTTTNYGNTTAIINLPATNLSLAVNATLSGLMPAATSHFRLVATNSAGASVGCDFSFRTLLAPVVTLQLLGANPLTNICHGTFTDPGAVARGSVVSIAAGGYHSLALKADDTVAAWGRNLEGQTNVPPSATKVVAIAAGVYHSLALQANGTVVAWGNINSGRTNVLLSATNVVAIAAGEYHSVALQANGTVSAWGRSGAGQTTVPASVYKLTVGVSGTVDIHTPGAYQLTYSATNNLGIVMVTNRTVMVLEGVLPVLNLLGIDEDWFIVSIVSMSGASGQTVVIESCTNLAAPVWVPVQTNKLGSSPMYFSEPIQPQSPARFYRLRTP